MDLLRIFIGRDTTGLTHFRNRLSLCCGKTEESTWVHEELEKIRKVEEGKSLSKYHKCVHKLTIIFVLGYKVDFGHLMAADLLKSNVFKEKKIGYLFFSVVKSGDGDFMHLVTSAIKADLSSEKEIFQNLGLQYIANNATSTELANSVFNEVMCLLLYSKTASVGQTAALALLQILRMKRDLVLNEFYVKSIINLMKIQDMKMLKATISLMEFLTINFSVQFQSCVGPCIDRLNSIVKINCNFSVSYPWTVAKLLRILNNYPAPSDVSLKSSLRSALENVLTAVGHPQTSKQNYVYDVKSEIAFEVQCLITKMGISDPILPPSVFFLNVLHHNDANYKYMALDMMTRVASNALYNKYINWKCISIVLMSEPDITIKKKAVDLLQVICDADNVKLIIRKMLSFLAHDCFKEIILKTTTTLVQKFNVDRKWYFDALLHGIQISVDKVNEDLWYSVVNEVILNQNLQKYAARKSYEILLQKSCKDIEIKIAGYILGEYGYQLAENPTCKQQLYVLKNIYPCCCSSTKALLLTTFTKFLNAYPELEVEIQSILKHESNIRNQNEEIQKQLAIEYLQLSEIASLELLESLLK